MPRGTGRCRPKWPRLRLLKNRAIEYGFNKVIVKTACNFWRGPRVLRLGCMYNANPYFALSGLPAGGIFNDLFVRVYSACAFDRFCSSHSQVTLSSCVDDDALTTEGSTEAEALGKMVMLACDILTAFGSSFGIAKKLGRLLGQMAGTVTNST
eukprot:9497293-Pyramimonas_sp.AAC.1